MKQMRAEQCMRFVWSILENLATSLPSSWRIRTLPPSPLSRIRWVGDKYEPRGWGSQRRSKRFSEKGFQLVLNGFGVPKALQKSMRTNMDKSWAGLAVPNVRDSILHRFGDFLISRTHSHYLVLSSVTSEHRWHFSIQHFGDMFSEEKKRKCQGRMSGFHENSFLESEDCLFVIVGWQVQGLAGGRRVGGWLVVGAGRVGGPKIGSLMGVWGSSSTDIWENGKGHKLRAYMLTDVSLVDTNFHFPNRKASIFMMFTASGNVRDPFKVTLDKFIQIKSRTIKLHFCKLYCLKSPNLGNHEIGKNVDSEMVAIRLINCWKSRLWNQSLWTSFLFLTHLQEPLPPPPIQLILTQPPLTYSAYTYPPPPPAPKPLCLVPTPATSLPPHPPPYPTLLAYSFSCWVVFSVSERFFCLEGAICHHTARRRSWGLRPKRCLCILVHLFAIIEPLKNVFGGNVNG